MSGIKSNRIWWILLILLAWITGILFAPIAKNGGYTVADGVYFFYAPTCHQIAERCLKIGNATLAVCTRCSGFYFGALIITAIYLFRKKIHLWYGLIYFLLCLPAVIDFLLGKLEMYESSHIIRGVTGILLGIAIFHILLLAANAEKPHPKADPNVAQARKG